MYTHVPRYAVHELPEPGRVNREPRSAPPSSPPALHTSLPCVLPKVSAGLVPRLLTLLPQMERLAKGAGCTPYPPAHPLAPQCNDADHYAPAFWPERLAVQDQASSGWASGLDLSEVLAANGGGGGGGGHVRGLRGGSEAEGSGGLGKGGRPAGAAAKKRRSNFRVVVATEDPAVEALLEEYDVS